MKTCQLSPQALFLQHLVQSPDGVDPQFSCFNVTGSDLLDREMSAAKSITSSVLAKGFPEGWLDETNLFPEEFDLNVELDLAAEFILDATLSDDEGGY